MKYFISLGDVCFTGSDIVNGLSKKIKISLRLLCLGDIFEWDVKIFKINTEKNDEN